MGFSTALLTGAIASTAATAANIAGGAINYRNQMATAKNMRQASDYNQKLVDQKTGVMNDEAIQNNIKMRKDAKRIMGQVRADASSSQVMSDGSIAVREMDEASRLENTILDQLRQSLNEIDDLKKDASVRKMNEQMQINSMKTNAASSLLSGFSEGLNNTSKTINQWYRHKT